MESLHSPQSSRSSFSDSVCFSLLLLSPFSTKTLTKTIRMEARLTGNDLLYFIKKNMGEEIGKGKEKMSSTNKKKKTV